MSQSRRTAPSFLKLEQAENESRNIFIELMNVDSENTEQSIRENINSIKDARKVYEEASKKLRDWYNCNGSSTEAQNVNATRLSLVYQEGHDRVSQLNALLTDLNLDSASDITKLSQKPETIAPSQQSEKAPSLQPNDEIAEYNYETQSVYNISASQKEVESPIALLPSSENSNNIISNYIDQCKVNFNNPMNLKDVDMLDDTSRHKLLHDLRRGLAKPFSGEPEYYGMWKSIICRRLLEAGSTTIDTLEILVANTKGEANELATAQMNACSGNPEKAFAKLWKSLDKRFGDHSAIAKALFDKIKSFPPIRSTSDTKQFRSFFDLCTIIENHKHNCIELQSLDLQEGMSRVWSKFPESTLNRWKKNLFQTSTENWSSA